MTEDARKSMQAWTSMLLFAGFLYAGLLVFRDIDIPSWMVWAGLPLAAIDVVLLVMRRRKERRPSGS